MTTPPPASLDAVLTAVDDIDGWMTPAQGARLHDAARAVPAGGQIVEIGSFRGRSTVVLGLSAVPDVSVVAIDPHAGNDRGPQEIDGFEDEAATDNEVFRANLARAGLTEKVRHVRAFSDAAHEQVTGSIDVLYIDGAHRYGPARADIVDWGARVAPGGRMLIHDSFSSVGVTLAILAALVGRKQWRYVGRSGSLTEYRRADLSPTARLSSAGRQLLQLGWFVRNLVIKVLIVAKLGRFARLLGHRQATWPY